MSSSGAGSEGEFFVLAKALRAFKTGSLADNPSDRALARAAGVSPTTIADWLRGTRFPQDIGKVLIVVRMVRAAAAHRRIAAPNSGLAGLLDEDLWRAAHQQEAQRRAGAVSDAVQRAQAISVLAGLPVRVRVRDADPQRLGVHKAISVPGVPDEVPPQYVPRDVDAAEFGVRAKVATAAELGGFVLLVGGSSVGKTRCALEAVKALLPDWWLVHPAGPPDVNTLAQARPSRTVVWLDELQRYLDGEDGLTGGVVRALLNGAHPIVIVGTLWSDWHTTYTTVPTSGSPDPHAREREVLGLTAVIRINPVFSPTEQDRARAAASHDPRLKIALQSAGYGLTQTLAAAPQLVDRWEDAQTADPYGWAVLTAALDTARLGARAPLSAGLLRAAAVDYCTSQQQAEAPDNWFEQALTYATGKLHGAVAALSPTGAGMGQIAGYKVADYLIQHASRERRYARVPASTWDAILSHIRDSGDATRLADSAQRRLLYRYAIALSRCAADTGDRRAASQLAWLLARRGDVEELRARADAGDEAAAERLADLLARRENLKELRARADTGDEAAAWRLGTLLDERGDVEELRARADAGDRFAARQLADLLGRRENLKELRARADAGDRFAARWLAMLLAERGDLDAAVQLLRPWADAGDEAAADLLADLLAQRGDLDAAVQLLRPWADAGDEPAAERLADLLAQRGDLDAAVQLLRPRADAGDRRAAKRLVGLLAQRGDLDGLRALADVGHGRAAGLLADLLAERGDLDGLRARADAGDEAAAWRLAMLLAERGDLDGLRARADAGDGHAAWRLAMLLAERGDLDGLRARADAGDGHAAEQLADLLAGRGDLDAAVQLLRARADAGDGHAAQQLARLLTASGDLDAVAQLLRARADAGDRIAAWQLADLLAERGDLDAAVQLLRPRADADDIDATGRLADLLARRGDLDALRARADAGDGIAAGRLAALLAGRGDLDAAAKVLQARAVSGYGDALELTQLLAKQGTGGEAERLHRFGLNPDGSVARA